MTHLTDAELVDLVEDRAGLDPRRAAHLVSCASCREEADTLRGMLRQAAAVEVPEPSPLFWEHMSNRVRDGVAAEPASGSEWNWFGIRLARVAGAAVLLLALLTGMMLIRIGPHEGDSPSAVAARASGVTPAPARVDGTPDAENAEVWAVLTAAASNVALEDARDAGMRVHPAAIDYAVQDLSAAELNELGRLLQSELKRASN